MASFARKLSTILQYLKRKFQRKRRPRRHDFVQAIRGGGFRRLEPRRVLSVNATLNAGVLDINILSNDADTTASLQSASATEFFVDANNNSSHDASELRALFSDLHQINVVGDGNATAFFWRDNFSTAILNSANAGGHVVSVNNVNTFESTATAVIDGNASFASVQSLKLNGDLTISGTLNASASNVSGTIESSAGAQLNVDGAAQLSAHTVNLNGNVGGTAFDDFSINTTGDATVAGTIKADSFVVKSGGLIDIDATADITATQVNLETLTTDADIQIDGSIRSSGDVDVQSQDSIQLGSGARLTVSGASEISLIANSDLLNSNGSDGISMSAGSTINADTGSILLRAVGTGAGDIQLGSLTTNSTAANAVEIDAVANIVDSSSDELPNISAANGTVLLKSLQGSIGATDDIDINAVNLVFNASGPTAGVVNISDSAGGLTINGPSRASGGGSLSASSPLTISANIDLGAGMTFTAGNSAAAGDSITINNNSIITLNSATGSTLSFNAGDDIVFASGRIVTTGATTHSVVLSADLDHTGLGAGDGDRGTISQDGLAGIEVSTNNLTASAATGIALDTAVNTLVASTTAQGNIEINEQDAITLTNVSAADGQIIVRAGAQITATTVNSNATNGTVELRAATGGLTATNVSAGSGVQLRAVSGDISTGILQSTNASVTVNAENGNVTVGSITAGQQVNVTATNGAISDAADDAIVDIVAGGNIALESSFRIGGVGADGRLDLAAGAVVSAKSLTSGDILLRGAGILEVIEASTFLGSIDVVAVGDIKAQTVSAKGVDGSVTLLSTNGGIQSTSIIAEKNVTLQAINGNIISETIQGPAGPVILQADAGSVQARNITASSTVDITAAGVNSDVALSGAIATGGNLKVAAADTVRFNAGSSVTITGTGNVTVTANSDALDGNDADEVFMADDATISASTGTILLNSTGASGGNVTLGAVSTNSLAANAVEIRSAANIIDGRTSEAANITAAGGTVNLVALQGSIGATDDIDINATNLIFNAASTAIGVVNITDLAGGVRISGSSQAGGGGSVTANSPLTISANVTVGASMVFTAGDSASGGDTITIDNNAIVTLDSTTSATLTFNAGDDIVFNTGQIVTQNGSHTVVLAADLDHAGVGSADGDRGSISQDGLAGLEVTTNALAASAATGIDLDTSVDTLIATTSATGNIIVDELNAITLTNVATADGAITIRAGGTLTAINVTSTGVDSDANDVSLSTLGAGDIVVRSVLAGPSAGDVILNSFANIIDGDTTDNLDISGNDVSLTAGGSIGGTSSDVFKGVFDPIEVNATGNLTATATTGAIALDANVQGTVSLSSITAYIESDGDLIAAPTFTVTNLALIADADRNGTGTLTLGPTLSVTGDLRIEGADIVATDGSIDLAANRLMVKSLSSELLNVTVNMLDASVFGDLTVLSSQAVELLDVDCDNVALQTVNSGGFIQLTAIGTILISDDVIAGNDGVSSSSGSITITARGATANLIVADTVLSDDGDIVLRADNDVRIGAPTSANEASDTDNLPVITTVNGNIRITADADSNANGNGGEFAMLDGSRIIAGRSIAADYVPGINGLPSPSTIALGNTVKPLGQAEITLSADESITLGSVQSMNASVNAIRITSLNGAIVDGGDANANLIANSSGALITLTANSGIGNSNAIETQAYAIDATNIDRIQPAQGNIAIDEINGGDLVLVHVSNQANSGNVFVRVQNGELTVPAAGFAPSNGLLGVTTEQGNILLQSLAADVTVASQVQSQGAHITLNAADDVRTSASVATSGAGSVYVTATNSATDAVGPEVDGVNIAAAVSTAAGDLLIRSNLDVRLTATVSSTLSDVGIVAGRDIIANNSTQAQGNLLIDAQRDVVMSALAGVSAGDKAIVSSGRNQTIAEVSANNVALSSGANIVDANGSALNIVADNLNIQAVGSVGASDTGNAASANDNAIDTSVTTVAAQGEGIYLRQTFVSSLTIGHVDAVNVSVDVSRVQFADVTTPESAARNVTANDDLTSTADGVIKVVVEAGSLIVTEGDDNDGQAIVAAGTGAVLLEARNFAADIVVQADAAIRADSGNVTLRAADDVHLRASVQTGGTGSIYVVATNNLNGAVGPAVDGINVDASITSLNGDILLSSTRDLRTTSTITSTTGDIGLAIDRNAQLNSAIQTGGNVLVDVGNTIDMSSLASITAQKAVLNASGTINLGLVAATDVALHAGQNILDRNGTATNVRSTNLRMTAGGSIGQNDLLNAPANNANAIDLEVTTVAAQSDSGIYLQELTAGGGLTIGHADDVAVEVLVDQVHFNSTTTSVRQSRTLGQLDDLTTVNGSIKVVADAGTISVTDGTDADNSGVQVGGAGDLLLEARGAASDIVIGTNATVRAAGGHISLIADDDVRVEAGISTVLSGSVFIRANNQTADDAVGPAVDGVYVNAPVSTANGDLLISSSRDIRVSSNVISTAGDIGFSATRDIALEAAVTTAANVLVDAGRDFTMANGMFIDANNVLVQAGGNATIGLLDANQVTVVATGSILDANGSATNVRATSASLTAGGMIGGSDVLNAPNANENAIDLEVVTLAAQSGTGTYLQQIGAAGNLTIGRVNGLSISIDVQQANFNSSTSPVQRTSAATALDDLTTTGVGPIKVVVLNGSLHINEGDDNDGFGIEARGGGDILLEARGATSDLLVLADATVSTAGGNIVFRTGDDIVIESEVRTNNTGSIYMFAASGTADAVLPRVDGINVESTVSSQSGNILLDTTGNVRLAASLLTTSGHLGLVAGGTISQLANLTTTGDILFAAGGDITSTGFAAQAGTNLVAISGATLRLGFYSATHVGLDAALNIDDFNGGNLTKVRADQLSMRAGTSIGAADPLNAANANSRAIDLEVGVVAANSADGIYLFEMAAGNNLTVGHVDAISVSIDVNGVNFNSTTTTVSSLRTTQQLDDLTTTVAGPIKVVVANGSLQVTDGSDSDQTGIAAGGQGNVLLEARGATGSDVVIAANASLRLGTGHLTISAADDVSINAEAITTGNGSIYVLAGNNTADGTSGIAMAAGSRLSTADGNVLLRANSEGDVLLGLVESTQGAVSISAEGSILDNNFDLNVRANELRLIADSNGNNLGTIGAPDTLNGSANTNANAIDTDVTTLSASAAQAIYVRELNGLIVGQTSQLTVSQANFNSSTTAIVDLASSDVVTTSGGAIKLQTVAGNLTIQDGNANGFGVRANGSGDVLLQTLAADGDILVNAQVTSQTGNISLRSGDDIAVNASITTGANGNLFLQASNGTNEALPAFNGVDVQSTLTTTNGNVLIDSSRDIRLAATLNSAGNVGLLADRDILIQANILTPQNVYVQADRDVTMNSGVSVQVQENAIINATDNLTLGLVQANNVGLNAGGSIIDGNLAAANVRSANLSMNAGNRIGDADPLNLPGLNANAIDLEVNRVAAQSASGIYLQQLAAAGSLAIGPVAAFAVTIDTNSVSFNSTTASINSGATQANLGRLTTVDGPIKVSVDAGSLTVLDGVESLQSGDVLLRSLTNDVIVETAAAVTSGTGHISLIASDDVLLKGNITTSNQGTVLLLATNSVADAIRGVEMQAGTVVTTSAGNVRIVADNEGDILLSQVNAGSGHVSLIAEGSILDNEFGVNVQADALRMVADAGVSNASDGVGRIGGADVLNGTPGVNANAIDTIVRTLAASSADGIYVEEFNGVIVTATPDITVEQVNFNSTRTTRTDLSLSDLTTTDAGPIKLFSSTGSITINDGGDLDGVGIHANNSGDVWLRSGQDLTITAIVRSGSGNITLIADDDVALSAAVRTAGAGQVYVLALNQPADANDGIAMLAGSSIVTAGGNVRLAADNEGDVRLTLIDAGSGSVSIVAEGSVIDGNGSALNVAATRLRMWADAVLNADGSQNVAAAGDGRGQIGASDLLNGVPSANVNAIDVRVATLAAQSATGIYLLESDGVTIDATTDLQFSIVNFNSTTSSITDASLSDLVTTAAGPIKVQSTTGNIVVNDGDLDGLGISANGSGDVLLQAIAGAITLNSDTLSGTGNISVLAAALISANAQISTTGNVQLNSGTGILMSATSVINSGAIVSLIATADGDVVLGSVTATGVNVEAGGSILDGNAALLNIDANTARLIADSNSSGTGSIGTADPLNGNPELNANAIDTRVNVLAARSATGIYIDEADGLRVDATGLISISQVNFNSTTSTLNFASLADLTTTHSGSIKLVSATGDVVVNDGDNNGIGVDANGSGDVLLKTGAVNGDVLIRAQILSGFGHISFIAGDDVEIAADVTTGANAQRGTVFVLATNASTDAMNGVLMQPASTITTASGNVRIAADNEGDIRLGRIDAGTAFVSLVAEGSILNNGNTLNVRSNNLRMWADAVVLADGAQDAAALRGDGLGSIGLADAANGQPAVNANAIRTQVDVLAARSATGIYVHEADGLTVGLTAAVSVERSNFNSTLTRFTDSAWQDLETTSAGPIKLQSELSNITLTDGNANGYSVRAEGSGDVLVQTLAASGDVIVQASILSGSGHISLLAGDDLHLSNLVNLKTAGAGTIYLNALNGTTDAALGVLDGINSAALIESENGDILLRSAADIRLSGNITSTLGDIGLVATRDVIQSSAIATGQGYLIQSGGAWTMQAGASVTAGTNLLALVGGNIDLYLLQATTVSLQATGDIVDANGGDLLNIQAQNLIMRSQGAIGASNLTAAPNVNANAIDIDVDFFAASAVAGIYVQQVVGAGTLTITGVDAATATISVGQVNFNSTRTPVQVTQTRDALSDVESQQGPVKIVVRDGSLLVDDGDDADNTGVRVVGGGDILLEARGATSDVQLAANILAGGGSITVQAGDDVRLTATLASENELQPAQGTIYIVASNATTDAALGAIDGVDIAGPVRNQLGDILINSAFDLRQTSNISSISGNIGLIVANDYLQSANVLTAGNVLVDIARDWTMSAASSIVAGSNLVGNADRDLRLGFISAENVALEVGRDLLDANGGNATNIAAVQASLRAGGVIGQANTTAAPGVNANAIEIDVDKIAADAAAGIYLRQIEGADNLVVDRVAAISVEVIVQQVNFNSSTTEIRSADTIDALSDIESDAGPIKLLVSTSSLIVNEGGDGDGWAINAGGAGDVLLQTRDASANTTSSDVFINADVLSGTGNITISAGDDVYQAADVITSRANVAATNGTIFVRAANASVDGIGADGVIMSSGVVTRSFAGVVRVTAENESDIVLALIDTVDNDFASGAVSLIAERSIVNVGGPLLEPLQVQTGTLRMMADANNNGVGAIGGSDVLNGSPDLNANAIRTQVQVLAASASQGIYVDEVDSVTITATGAIQVERVNFNSTLTSVVDASQADLVSSLGPVKLLSRSGSITVNDGDTSGFGVNAATSGDVLLWARQDLLINADVQTGTGHITLRAGDDVDLNADLTTSGSSIYILAINDTVDALRGVDMQQGTLVSSTGGNVRIVADNEGDILLSQVNAGSGHVSLIAEGSILDNEFGVNVQADALRMVADAGVSNASDGVGRIGGADALNGTPGVNANAIDTIVRTLAASSADGIYIEEFDGVIVDATPEIAVQEVRFNSTRTTRTDSRLADLESTDAGSIKLVSRNGSIEINDGDADSSGLVAATSGDVLLWARQDVVVNANVRSGSGHVTLRADDDVDLNANLLTGGGSVFITATNDTLDAIRGVDMQRGTLVSSAGGNVRTVADNEGDILLSQVDAGSGDVSLMAEGSILDNEFAVNVRADALRMVADASLSNTSNNVGSIGLADALNGTADSNRFAIDTQVNVLAARSADGIYVQEFDAVNIDATLDIAVEEVRFNSTRTIRTDASLSDLETTDAGPIKLVSLNGAITVNDGDADGSGVIAARTGDVLLWARQDVIVHANVRSGSGHVTLRAGDDVEVNANLITGGGSVYVAATNDTVDAVRGVAMGQGTLISTAEGNVRILADNEGDILLSHVDAGLGDVSLIAEGSILDNEFAMNIRADALRMVADAAISNSSNQVGSIGLPDRFNGQPDTNRFAIDTSVNLLAARSADRIYIQEFDSVVIDATPEIAVEEVRFNSTRTVRSDATLSDLQTTVAGAIKLVSTTGEIRVNDGDADGFGISAASSGDVLLWAGQDIVLNSVVQSGTGHITLRAADDIAMNANVTTLGGSVYLTATNNTADSVRGVVMQQGTLISTTLGNVRIVADNEGDILLSQIDAGAGNVSLLAEGSILDNEFDVNIRANALRMVADASISNASNQAGSIGLADTLNGSADSNRFAIDTRVNRLSGRSADSIYIEEFDSVTVDSSFVFTVEEVQFESTRVVRSDAALADLETTDAGSIKLVSLNGSITVLDGDLDGVGIVAATTGDVLLRAQQDVIVSSDLQSGTGRIQLRAFDDVDVNADVSTGGSGTIYITAENQSSDSLGSEVDGINIDGTLVTATGDVLLDSKFDIAVRANITSGTGDIGFEADRDITQSANIATTGNVILDAGRNLTTASANSVTGGNNIVVRTVGSMNIGLIAATNVSLEAGGDILDSNGGSVTNVRGTNLSMRAGGSIGTSDLTNADPHANRNAIDLEVTTLAASAGTVIYVQEVSAGGDLTIGHVDAISVQVDVNRVNFNSTTTPVQKQLTLGELDDLTSTGPLKVLVEAGSLNVTAGNDNDSLAIRANGASDILLEVRGASSDIVIGSNADVISAGGNIALVADDDVLLVGDLETDRATVYVRANDRTADASSGVVMGDNAYIRTHSGSIVIEANNESDIIVGLLDTVATDFSAGSVSLRASGSILENAGDRTDLNIQTGTLRLEADSNGDQTGSIGLISPANGNFVNSIDIQVQSLAARSAEGIYLLEVDGVTVRATGDIDAVRVHFNSSSSVVTHASLSDLETTNNGNVVLVTDRASVQVADGDDDLQGITVAGSGNVLLITSALDGDIVIDANVISSTGQITMSAGSDVILSATVQTGRNGQSPDILLQAVTGFIDEGVINGDRTKVIAGSLQLQAALHAHLHDTTIDSLTAMVGKNGLLQSWQIVNDRANQRGDDFLLDALGQSRVDYARRNGVLTQIDPSQANNPSNAADPQGSIDVNAAGNNPSRTSYEAVERLHRFADTYAGQYALFLKNSKTLDVELVMAGSSANPNVYIETDGAQSDLKVSGTIATVSNEDCEGGIVLVAGRQLQLEGQLATSSNLRKQLVDIIGNEVGDNADRFGSQRSVLNATIFDGGQGIQPQDSFVSSQFVIRLNNQAKLYEDFRSHIYQRVVTHLGFENEAGFMSYIGYADGNVQQFDVAGETGVRDGSTSELNLSNQAEIKAALAPSQAIVFTRSIAFTNSFLDSNQTLPTVAIVRRADDFFLFENASATNSEDIVDLTVEYQEVQEVFSLGGRGATVLPVDPVAPTLATPARLISGALITRPTDLQVEEIEFAAPPSGDVVVAIYRVYYVDKNSNGQPEQNELPSPDDVKSASIADENEAAELEQSDSEELKKKRFKVEGFQTKTDGSPTAEDIDALKQSLLDDSTQKTGAYSIIQKEVDGKEVVLDVFSVRDWEETPPQDQPLIQLPQDAARAKDDKTDESPEEQPTPSTNDSSLNEPAPLKPVDQTVQAKNETRFASVGLIAGSLWMIRESSKNPNAVAGENQDAVASAAGLEVDGGHTDVGQTLAFSRQARRARKLRGLK